MLCDNFGNRVDGALRDGAASRRRQSGGESAGAPLPDRRRLVAGSPGLKSKRAAELEAMRCWAARSANPARCPAATRNDLRAVRRAQE